MRTRETLTRGVRMSARVINRKKGRAHVASAGDRSRDLPDRSHGSPRIPAGLQTLVVTYRFAANKRLESVLTGISPEMAEATVLASGDGRRGSSGGPPGSGKRGNGGA